MAKFSLSLQQFLANGRFVCDKIASDRACDGLVHSVSDHQGDALGQDFALFIHCKSRVFSCLSIIMMSQAEVMKSVWDHSWLQLTFSGAPYTPDPVRLASDLAHIFENTCLLFEFHWGKLV